jgi:predicted RNA-binding Zn-ribbon protein involved in translation (DUF1610 family)
VQNVTLPCPTCGDALTEGWLAMWNPIVGQKVRWQESKPGYVRMRVPEGAKVVMKTRAGGKDARPAHRCSSCATVVIPPDASYDG